MKKFTIEELELIAPGLAQEARRHGKTSVSIDEVLSCCGKGKKQEQAGQYSSLNDAAAVASRYADLSPGGTEVWYARPESFRAGVTGELDIGPTLPQTHILLGKVAETDPESLYMALQGEVWSPRGEARSLIMSKGLAHTSMSMGDVLVIGGQLYMVDSFGFKRVESVKKRLPIAESNTVFGSPVAGRNPLALRQWMWEPMHLGAEKAPREQVNYRPGMMEGRMELRNQVCDTCRFMMPGYTQEQEEEGVRVIGRCELVEGNIMEYYTCDLWQPDNLKSSLFLQKIHAAEAAMKGEPFQEHTNAEYVEAAMEFVEAGEDPDAVIDFLIDPEAPKTEAVKHERLRRHYHPELSSSELDDLASKLVAKGYDAKNSAPYLITDAPQNVIDGVIGGWLRAESLKQERDMIYLSIDDAGRMTATTPDDAEHVIASEEDLARLVEKHPGMPVFASSSLDFPESETSDPAVIALAKTIRSY